MLDNSRPKLFEDELFERSQTWKLSTSGLSAGHLFRGTGLVSDGEIFFFLVEVPHAFLMLCTDLGRHIKMGMVSTVQALCIRVVHEIDQFECITNAEQTANIIISLSQSLPLWPLP